MAALFSAGVALWTIAGPLRPGWNATANLGHGSGSRVALASGTGASAAAQLSVAFSASLRGTVSQNNGGEPGDNGGAVIQIDTTLSGGMQGSLHIALQGQATPNGGTAIAASRVDFAPAGTSATYAGQVTGMNGNRLVAICTGSGGNRIRLDLQLAVDSAGDVTGTIGGTRA